MTVRNLISMGAEGFFKQLSKEDVRDTVLDALFNRENPTMEQLERDQGVLNGMLVKLDWQMENLKKAAKLEE
jgi:hypothetical protein